MLRLIDTNIFIETKNDYYSMENCPGFWEWLSQAFNDGKLISAEAVYKEILDGNPDDPLISWIEPFEMYFLTPDEDIEAAYAEVAEYVRYKYTNVENIEAFLLKADAWLIATAIAEQRAAIANAGAITAEQIAAVPEIIVVTNETLILGDPSDDPSDSKVKIPNVCKAFGIKCETKIFSFMKHEKVRLVLGKKGK